MMGDLIGLLALLLSSGGALGAIAIQWMLMGIVATVLFFPVLVPATYIVHRRQVRDWREYRRLYLDQASK